MTVTSINYFWKALVARFKVTRIISPSFNRDRLSLVKSIYVFPDMFTYFLAVLYPFNSSFSERHAHVPLSDWRYYYFSNLHKAHRLSIFKFLFTVKMRLFFPLFFGGYLIFNKGICCIQANKMCEIRRLCELYLCISYLWTVAYFYAHRQYESSDRTPSKNVKKYGFWHTMNDNKKQKHSDLISDQCYLTRVCGRAKGWSFLNLEYFSSVQFSSYILCTRGTDRCQGVGQ